jgi:hypothetical protein
MWVALLLASCGGGAVEQPPAAVAEATFEPEPEPAAPVEEPEVEAPSAPNASQPEPEFKPGMSVNEAIAAVPEGVQRLNVDNETLAEPLQEPETFAACNLAANQKFKVRVAVWNGKAVGLDVTTTPKNPNVERCIRERIGALEWKAKVRSLDTIEYAF